MKYHILTVLVYIFTVFSVYSQGSRNLAPETLFHSKEQTFLKDLSHNAPNNNLVAALLNEKLKILALEPSNNIDDPKENVLQQLVDQQHKAFRYGQFDGRDLEVMMTEAKKLRQILVEQLSENWPAFQTLLKEKYGHNFQLAKINDIIMSYHSSGTQKDVWKVSFNFNNTTVSLALAALKISKILHDEGGKAFSFGTISLWEQKRMQILYDEDQIVPLYGWEGNIKDGRNYFFSEFIEGDILYDVPESSYTEEMTLDVASVWAKMIAKLYQNRDKIIDMELDLKRDDILKTNKNISESELQDQLKTYKSNIDALLMPSDINGENVMFEIDHEQTKSEGQKVYGKARIIDTGNKEVRGMQYQDKFDIFELYSRLTGYSNALEKLQLAKSLSTSELDLVKQRIFFTIIAELSSSIPYMLKDNEISIFQMINSIDNMKNEVSSDYSFQTALTNLKSLAPVLTGNQWRDAQFFQYFVNYLGPATAKSFLNNFAANLKSELLIGSITETDNSTKQNIEFSIQSIEQVIRELENNSSEHLIEHAA